MHEPALHPRLPRGMVVTDLDGTLRNSTGAISSEDLDTLRAIGREGYLRVIATGRSLYSFRRIKERNLPVDYVVFSSGAGIYDYPVTEIIRSVGLDAAQMRRGASLLLKLGLDFMIHLPIPDNHRFLYHDSGRGNADLRRRCELYDRVCSPFDGNVDRLGPGAQLIAIVPSNENAARDADDGRAGLKTYETIRGILHDYSVIRATSPLDGRSTWIEIFPACTSKGTAIEWLAREHDLGAQDALCLGNDYNDLDMLQWARTSFVVSNAPADLKHRFESVGSNDENGFSQAVRRWLAAR